jgi:nitrate/TMAO reductase-like tetraheme cytochrome c subunit
MDDTTPRIGRVTAKVAALIEVVRRPGARVRAIVRAVLALGALSMVVLVAAGPVTLSAPRACTVCHVSGAAYTEWQASPHASVRCERCHTDRAALAGVGNSFALVSDVSRNLGGGRAGTVSVPSSACLSCHPYSSLNTPKVVRGLRMSHKGLAEAGYRCVDCHANAAHTVPPSRLSSPTMSMCARCHNNVNVSGTCTLCHSQTKSPDVARRSDPEWSKTHGPNWRQLHGMGDLSTCTMCHDSQECQKCHNVPLPHDADFIGRHGTLAKASKQACLSCHRQSFCDNCHGLPIPHPAGFLSDHPKVARGYEDARCLRCHVADDCASCHARHVHAHGPAIKQ